MPLVHAGAPPSLLVTELSWIMITFQPLDVPLSVCVSMTGHSGDIHEPVMASVISHLSSMLHMTHSLWLPLNLPARIGLLAVPGSFRRQCSVFSLCNVYSPTTLLAMRRPHAKFSTA